jgi:hypothetical protein
MPDQFGEAFSRERVRLSSGPLFDFDAVNRDRTADEPGGDRVSEVTADWSDPQINYALTLDNVRKWRQVNTRSERAPVNFGVKSGNVL